MTDKNSIGEKCGLEQNNALVKSDGSLLVDNDTLAALTLFIAPAMATKQYVKQTGDQYLKSKKLSQPRSWKRNEVALVVSIYLARISHQLIFS
jgi:hypothetical protein